MNTDPARAAYFLDKLEADPRLDASQRAAVRRERVMAEALRDLVKPKPRPSTVDRRRRLWDLQRVNPILAELVNKTAQQ